MSLSDHTYSQPEKNSIRERIIAESIKALTLERSSSPVVPVEVFNRTLDYSTGYLKKHCGIKVDDRLKSDSESWLELHSSRVGMKKPSDLHVLFLAGPDPTNDLMTFRQHGITFENI